MEKIYLLLVVVFCFIFIVRLFSLFRKKDNGNQKLIETEISNIERDISNKKVIETNHKDEKGETSNEELSKPIITTKNTFLYPDDDFGTMKNGKVYNSITYESGIIDKNSNVDKMKIITIKKKNKSSK